MYTYVSTQNLLRRNYTKTSLKWRTFITLCVFSHHLHETFRTEKKTPLNYSIKIILFMVSNTVLLPAWNFLFSFIYKYSNNIDCFDFWSQATRVMPPTRTSSPRVHQYTISQIIRSCKNGAHNLESSKYLLAASHLWTPGNQESNNHQRDKRLYNKKSP